MRGCPFRTPQPKEIEHALHRAASLGERVLAILAILALLSGCVLPDYGGLGVRPVSDPALPARVSVLESGSAQVTVVWEPPVKPWDAAVDSYKVYYRRVTDHEWIMLSEVSPQQSLQVTVDHRELGDGEFEFAVFAESPAGESPIHRSSEATATPSTGWILKWQTRP